MVSPFVWSLLLALSAASHAAAPSCAATVAELALPTELAADARLRGPAVIVVSKAERKLGLYADGALRGCWSVGLASAYPAGTKQRRGDKKTPEGWYRTSDKPWSSFYKAIAIHYPEVRDADRGLADGLITAAERDAVVAALATGAKPPQETALGGEILIHGGGGSTDWTLGCVALDDRDIETLRAGLPEGMRTDVLILP